MEFRCPSCGLSGRIDDQHLPPGGLAADCPRCTGRVVIGKTEPVSDPAALLGTVKEEKQEKPLSIFSCPSCGCTPPNGTTYDACPLCGTAMGRKKKAPRRRTRELPAVPRGHRPAAIVAISCIYIFAGLALGMSGYLALTTPVPAKVFTWVPLWIPGLKEVTETAHLLARYIRSIGMAQIGAGCFVIFASVAFFRMKKRGRAAVEAIGWTVFAVSLLFSILATILWYLEMKATVTAAGALGTPTLPLVVRSVVSLVSRLAVLLVPQVAILRQLRSPAVCEACSE